MHVPVYIEARLRPEALDPDVSAIENAIYEILEQSVHSFVPGPLPYNPDAYPLLYQSLETLNVVDLYLESPEANFYVPYWMADVQIRVFSLAPDDDGEGEEEYIQGGVDAGGNAEYTSAAQSYSLPSAALEGLWDSIIVPPAMKQQLVAAAEAGLLLATAGVSANVVSFNRLLLMYGPPGTGKTSLAMSLAHKLAIRLQPHFPSPGRLLVVNSHSLFSRFYSESGKLVSAMFRSVREAALDDPRSFLVVVIDEVESLSAAREAAVRSGDPSDSIRVVNALLTQLDSLRRLANVLVVTTSNLLSSVDPAFLDRADVKLHVDLPPLEARYKVLVSGVAELEAKGVLAFDAPEPLPDAARTLARGYLLATRVEGDRVALPSSAQPLPIRAGGARDLPFRDRVALEVALIAKDAAGLSGRILRKLPFVALTRLAAHFSLTGAAGRIGVTEHFLPALAAALAAERLARKDLK